MIKKKAILFGLVALGAWFLYQRSKHGAASNENYFVDVSNVFTSVGDAVMELVPVSFRLSNARKVDVSVLDNQNVKAFLQVIRKGEGTLGEVGYSTLFGGSKFVGFSDHPRQTVTRGRYTSTAAGAYQFLSSTWDETSRIMGLQDFSPASQDIAAVGRIAIRGALADVLAGRFESAVRKTAKEWASLPFSPYGQPTQSLAAARSFYLMNNGVESA
jgi:muramidase (phage lysozyme)